MKRLNSNRMSVVVVGIVAMMVVGGGIANADFTFSERVNLGSVVNSSYADGDPFIAPDGLSLYFNSFRPGGYGDGDIWVSIQQTSERNPEGFWGPPVNLGAPVNSEYYESQPSITADGLMLVFTSDRPGGLGVGDIWVATRPSKDDPWGEPVNLGSPINSDNPEFCPCISPDGCSLYFSKIGYLSPTNPDIFYGGQIYMTTRATRQSPWETPVKLDVMPSRQGSGNWGANISSDGLALFFYSDYADVSLLPDIWLATRRHNDDGWETPIRLGSEINTQNGEQKPSISADGSTLYWCCGRANLNTWDLWQSTLSPIVDFNADGNIDTIDLVMLIDGWNMDDTLYDIGPMPWGDGVVDIEDLKVFIKHWEQENVPEIP